MNRCSIKKLFLEISQCWSLFSNKNAGLRARNFIKKKLKQMCFPVNNAKILGTSILS